MSAPTVMLVAAEPSGDLLGAELALALRRAAGDRVRLVGIGGSRMAALGFDAPRPGRDIAVVGFANAALAYPRVLARVREAVAVAGRETPDVAVLIDSWGFTLRVARGLRRLRRPPKIVKYVGPQVWAMRPGRARTLAGVADLLLALHPFDAPYFTRWGLAARFVGNPVFARLAKDAEPEEGGGAAPRDGRTLLVLPGSRRSELARLLPPFGAAAARLRARFPGLDVAVAAAEGLEAPVAAAVAAWPFPARIVCGDADRRRAMRRATVSLACSGTATTELAVAGCPMVVAYRLDPVTHFLARFLIRTPYISLINVAADRFVVPEFVQGRCTGPRLAEALAPLLESEDLRAEQAAAQSRAAETLRGGVDDPSAAAAAAILDLIEKG